MEFYSGYYYCHSPIWDNIDYYSCGNMIAIYKNHYKEEDKPYGVKDFENLIETKKIFDNERYEYFKGLKTEKGLEDYKQYCYKNCNYLSPKVEKWLIDNVLDDQKGGKGWCCGNDSYNSSDSDHFSLFFYRRRDALKFIKEFSVYKKPTQTCNQNSGKKQRLDLKTMKLVTLPK